MREKRSKDKELATLLADTELRLVVRIFARAFSAASARSSASSKLCCTLRYLAKLTAASSSYLPNNNTADWRFLRLTHREVECSVINVHTTTGILVYAYSCNGFSYQQFCINKYHNLQYNFDRIVNTCYDHLNRSSLYYEING